MLKETAHNRQESHPTPGSLWESIETEIKNSLKNIFQTELSRLQTKDLEEAEETTDKLIQREERFFIDVLTIAERAIQDAQTENDIIILFDIDETIGVYYTTGENNTITKLRPSLFPLLNELKSKGLKIGFISSRGREAMLEQLQKENNLAPINAYIDKNLVFSSRGYRTRSSDEFARILIETFGGKKGILNDDLLRSANEYELPSGNGDQQKITLLQEIKETNPDKKIIAIDDCDYPRFLNEQNGLYGVALTHNNGIFHKP